MSWERASEQYSPGRVGGRGRAGVLSRLAPWPRRCSEDDQNAKAYFRRAVARSYLDHYAEAAEDLATAQELDPTIAGDVDKELRRQQARQRQEAAKSRRDFASFFDRH